MSRISLSWVMSSAILSFVWTVCCPVKAEPLPGPKVSRSGDPAIEQQLVNYQGQRGRIARERITSVSELSDVQPTDWYFRSLQSLVERYQCISGYPDGTFRPNRAITRKEFVAALNACLEKVTTLLAEGKGGSASQDDLALIKKLQENFAADLSVLRARLDSAEERVEELEENQFSTTTKLAGEAVFTLAGVATGNRINGEDITKNTVFGDRLRLEFESSFTGKDLLFTRLATGNTKNLLQGITPEGALGFEQDEENIVGLEVLLYQFPIGDRTTITVGPAGVATDDFTDTINVLDGDGGSGAISLFGTRNSIYYPPEGAGFGVRHEFNDVVAVSAGYLASEANDPNPGFGLFDGAYGAIAQLLISPSDDLQFGLTYVRGYNVEFGTGSNRANPKTFIEDLSGEEANIDSDSVGLGFSWQLGDRFVLGGWGAYSQVNVLSGDFDGENLDIWSWAVTLGFPDVLKKGNLAGVLVGMEPKVTRADTATLEDQNTSLHVEGFFQFQVNDNLAITPGIIWLTAPDHNNDNNDVVLGVIRTTFSF